MAEATQSGAADTPAVGAEDLSPEHRRERYNVGRSCQASKEEQRRGRESGFSLALPLGGMKGTQR